MVNIGSLIGLGISLFGGGKTKATKTEGPIPVSPPPGIFDSPTGFLGLPTRTRFDDRDRVAALNALKSTQNVAQAEAMLASNPGALTILRRVTQEMGLLLANRGTLSDAEVVKQSVVRLGLPNALAFQDLGTDQFETLQDRLALPGPATELFRRSQGQMSSTTPGNVREDPALVAEAARLQEIGGGRIQALMGGALQGEFPSLYAHLQGEASRQQASGRSPGHPDAVAAMQAEVDRLSGLSSRTGPTGQQLPVSGARETDALLPKSMSPEDVAGGRRTVDPGTFSRLKSSVGSLPGIGPTTFQRPAGGGQPPGPAPTPFPTRQAPQVPAGGAAEAFRRERGGLPGVNMSPVADPAGAGGFAERIRSGRFTPEDIAELMKGQMR